MNAIARDQFKNDRFKEAAIAGPYTNEIVYSCADYIIKPRLSYRRFFNSLSDQQRQPQMSRSGYLIERFGILGQFKPWMLLTSADIARLELASAYRHDTTPQLPAGTNFVTDRIGDFLASDGTVIQSESNHLISLLIVATGPTCLCGVTHIIAWNAPFSSMAQSTMWRLSGVTLFIPFVIVALQCLHSIVKRISPWILRQILSNHPIPNSLVTWISTYRKRVFYSDKVDRVMGILFYIFTFFAILAFCLYILARVFLIVECFVSLTYVPYTVFTVPNWSSYFPHIG